MSKNYDIETINEEDIEVIDDSEELTCNNDSPEFDSEWNSANAIAGAILGAAAGAILLGNPKLVIGVLKAFK